MSASWIERVVAQAPARLGGGRLARLTIWAAAALFASLIIDLVIAKLTGWSSWSPFAAWLKDWHHIWEDSWNPMNAALAYWRAHPDGRLYQELFFREGVKFQYPPTSLLPWLAFDAVGFPRDYIALNNLNRLFILVNAAAVGALAWMLLGRWTKSDEPRARLALAILVGGAVFLFYPVMKAWHLGQIQVWINAAFACACIAWLKDKRALAGGLIAGIALLKPQIGLFLLWGLVRRDWRFVLGFCGFGGAMGVLSLALFGVQNHLDYLAVLSELSRHGESFFNNQSVNGLLNRLLHNGSNLTFEDTRFPPYNPFVHCVTLLTSLALIGFAVWPRNNADPLFDFLLAGLCFTMASPIAWEHHYGVMAPMEAALFCWFAARPTTSAREWLVFGLCYVFTSMSFLFLNVTADTPFNFVQSHLFFGALGVLYLLWRARSGALMEKPRPA